MTLLLSWLRPIFPHHPTVVSQSPSPNYPSQSTSSASVSTCFESLPAMALPPFPFLMHTTHTARPPCNCFPPTHRLRFSVVVRFSLPPMIPTNPRFSAAPFYDFPHCVGVAGWNTKAWRSGRGKTKNGGDDHKWRKRGQEIGDAEGLGRKNNNNIEWRMQAGHKKNWAANGRQIVQCDSAIGCAPALNPRLVIMQTGLGVGFQRFYGDRRLNAMFIVCDRCHHFFGGANPSFVPSQIFQTPTTNQFFFVFPTSIAAVGCSS